MPQAWNTLTDPARFSAPGLAATRVWKRLRRRLHQGERPTETGHCPNCDHATTFVRLLDSPRDGLVCVRCGSVQRQRALARVVLDRIGEDTLRQASVHAASPSLCSYDFYQRAAKRLVGSYYWPERSAKRCGTFLNIDLQEQSFDSDTFDLVISEDVLEHVADPEATVREISRTLKPGGLHVFTIPHRATATTRTRAMLVEGRLVHLLEPQYHEDPTTRRGALVMTDWGSDTCERIARWGGGDCHIVRARVEDAGVPESVDIFVFKKARTAPRAVDAPPRATTASERVETVR